MDDLNDEATQTELEEWLQTTDADVLSRMSSVHSRQGSNISDERIFGIDAQTALRAALQDGVELASSGVSNTHTSWDSHAPRLPSQSGSLGLPILIKQ